MMLYTESAVDRTDDFAVAFVCENDVYGYDVVTPFESLQLMPFCLEKYSLRKWTI